MTSFPAFARLFVQSCQCRLEIASYRFMKFTEVKIKSFTEEQENAKHEEENFIWLEII